MQEATAARTEAQTISFKGKGLNEFSAICDPAIFGLGYNPPGQPGAR